MRALERSKRAEWAEPGPAAPGALRLVPFAFESQGRLRPEGCDEVAHWARERVAPIQAQLGPLRAAAAKAALLRRWRARLSVALARGLADMLAAGRRPPPAAPSVGVEALWEAL